jgi:hypothetical protein
MATAIADEEQQNIHPQESGQVFPITTAHKAAGFDLHSQFFAARARINSYQPSFFAA